MAVLAGEFVCPKCNAKLRIFQQGKTSAEFDCPECELALHIQRSAQGEIAVVPRDENGLGFVTEQTPLWKKTDGNSNWFMKNSLLVCMVVFIGMLFCSWSWFSSDDEKVSQALKPNVPDHKDVSIEQTKKIPILLNDVPQETSIAFEARLQELGLQVKQYQTQHNSFPPALWGEQENENLLPRDQRFSWLAGLNANSLQDQSLLPQWNLSWQDPLNARFVRRQRIDLLNPILIQKASEDRYPATHIVGISGVGDDAPKLPANHSRAGVFGYDRTTHIEDVKDGLSNTMLAAGVVEQFSSWAQGTKSIRAFTQQPYINGPDHFGNGSQKGMLVLMADGSVRFLNSKTEPVVIRRMAAMADGFSLDPKHPGEPGDKEKNPENPSIAVKIETPKPIPDKKMPDQKPADSEKKPQNQPPVKVIDFKTVLAQKVLDFDLSTPAPLESVLVELEALIGIRIEFDPQQFPADGKFRQQKVSFSKRNASYHDILTGLLEPISFHYKTRENQIVIERKKD